MDSEYKPAGHERGALPLPPRYHNADPNGIGQHAPGSKLDAGKVDPTLVPWEAVEAIAVVMGYGAAKYTRDGWREVPDGQRRYLAAALRHIGAYLRGESFDPETRLHHLDHALCNLAFHAALRQGTRDYNAIKDNRSPQRRLEDAVRLLEDS